MSERRSAMEADIAVQRDQLAGTVDQLAHKLDVKAQAKERAVLVRDRATTPSGRPRPELVATLVGTAVALGLLVWWRRR
jgi:Protein of unknown function (DUF3618)